MWFIQSVIDADWRVEVVQLPVASKGVRAALNCCRTAVAFTTLYCNAEAENYQCSYRLRHKSERGYGMRRQEAWIQTGKGSSFPAAFRFFGESGSKAFKCFLFSVFHCNLLGIRYSDMPLVREAPLASAAR